MITFYRSQYTHTYLVHTCKLFTCFKATCKLSMHFNVLLNSMIKVIFTVFIQCFLALIAFEKLTVARFSFI